MQGSGFLVYLNCCATFERMNLERLGNLVRLKNLVRLGKIPIALSLNSINTIFWNFEF